MKPAFILLTFSFIILTSQKLNLRTLANEPTNIIPTEKNVKIIGRYAEKDDAIFLIHSGSSIEFYATGASLSVTLLGDNGIYNDEKYRPHYGIFVDDEIVVNDLMSELEVSKTVLESPFEKKKIRLMLLSENNNGGFGVKSIDIVSDKESPISPTEKKNLTIEFIGDSITCAYGVEGANQYENFKTSTENFSKSYAYLAAKKLDADYYVCSYSGHGVVSGYTTGEKNPDSLLPDYYTKLSRYADYKGDWDFENHKVDVVFVNLGTNDNNYVTADPDTRNDEFVEEYKNFLGVIRDKNPDAYILCTVGIMGCEAMYPLIEQAIKLTGDEKISSYKSPTQDMQNDGLGSDWHPSAVTHIKNSNIVADKICNVIGRESDQVGLDVASEAVYNVTGNEANGAHFFWYEGWGRMFSIGGGPGGKSVEDVEATCTGIELKKNGVYVLEFDYSTQGIESLPILIRGEGVYFEDKLVGSSSEVHYSKEIVSSVSEKNTQLVFQLGGGTNTFSLLLKNIKMMKTK